MMKKSMLNVVDLKRKRGEQLFKEGKWMEEQGEYLAAIERYLKSAKLDPGNSRGFISAGLLYDQLEEMESAKCCFKEAILGGKEPLAYYCLGYIYEKEGDFDNALKNYKESVTLISDFAEGYLGMGDIYLRLGNFQQAQIYYEKALYADPLNLMGHVKRNSIKRYMEFVDPFPAGSLPPPKIQVYAERGAINLGVDYDDGINIPRYFFHNFSYHSLCVVMKRFQCFQEAYSWNFTKVVCNDDLSFPLGLSIAKILGLPISTGNDIFARDRILIVHGVGDGTGTINKIMIKLLKKEIFFRTLFFAVPPGVFYQVEPNIIGVHAQASLPWFRVDEFSRYQVQELESDEVYFSLDDEYIDDRLPELVADELMEKYATVADDNNYEEQTDWYFSCHNDLNFNSWDK